MTKTPSKQTASLMRAYFSALPPAVSLSLKEIRDAIRAAAPDAVEDFSYGMPAFKLQGQSLVWYAAWKRHFSLYPMGPAIVRANATHLEGGKTEKGTIRFALSNPPSPALVKRLIEARMSELQKAGKPK